MAFSIIPGAAVSPIIIHVPHASRSIPADVRASILLDDVALEAELNAMTDAHTNALAFMAVEYLLAPPEDSSAQGMPGSDSPLRPWLFVNQASRLVIDPERFPDEREEMNTVGMGAVYTRTSDLKVLREDDPARDAHLIATYFTPYSNALADLVDERLTATGRCVLIDLHSYAPDALPYERHGEDPRPRVCLGTDDVHTPPAFLAAARDAFAPLGDVACDAPFRGTYVPLRHYGRDARVASLMVELRRDGYSHVPGGPLRTEDDAAQGTARALTALVASRWWEVNV